MAKNNNKFTETPIPLLGGKHYFNRCPVETLTLYDKKLVDLFDRFAPIEKESNKLVEEVELIQNKINTLNILKLWTNIYRYIYMSMLVFY